MTDDLLSLLTALYGQDAPATAAQIRALMQSAAAKLPPPRPDGELFSELDVVLITYGDTLQAPGQSPLQSLHHFARHYLRGVISTIHILPFYPYSSDDGFSVQDFYAVNSSLGDWSDIEALGQDFALMFDAVFNHMSAQSAWFQAFLAGDPDFQQLFRTEDPAADLSSVTRPRATPLLTAFQHASGDSVHAWTTFSADQVDLDVRHPSTLLRLLEILLFYVEKGARIIRLDAIAYLWKEVGTSSIHLPQTHSVIQVMRAVLDAVAPGVILITETNVPHAENISYFGDGYNEAQMVYNFTLPPLLLHSLLTMDSSKLRDWVNSLHSPSERSTFFNFTASHDGIGVRPVEGILSPQELNQLIAHVEAQGGRVSYKRNSDGSQSPYELNITYVDAIAQPADSPEMQARRFLLTQGIMLALAGVPAVYIHSLLGSQNDLAGMEASGQNRRINRAKLQRAAVEKALADEQSFRARVFNAYCHLIRTRRAEAAFHPNAPQQALALDNPQVFALRRGEGPGQVLALYNLSGQAQQLNLQSFADGPLHDLLTGESLLPQCSLSPYEMRWLKTRR